MSAPSDLAWHYDGLTAWRRSVAVEAGDDGLRLIEGGVTSGPFAWDRLRATGEPHSFGLAGVPGWRLRFDGQVPPALAARLPGATRYGGVIDRWGLWRAAGAFAVLAVLAVVLVLRTPALVARLVPAAVEQRLGDVMLGDFGRRGCTSPDGDAALTALVRRLDPYDPTVEVHVVKLPVVNAVTLPGNRILLFDGLVQAARSPDEVAGVIAHELGHARHHDVLASLIRQFGLSVLLGGLDGHVGGATNALLSATYSRDAEARADGFAIELLREQRISPLPTAAFFRRLDRSTGRDPSVLGYLASHPVSADRAKRFAASARAHGGDRPVLDPAGWAALRGICRGQPAMLDWRF